MSYSIKYLFAIVAVAAVFTAAFVVQNNWWSAGIVGLTLGILLAVTVGLSLRVLYKPVWLSFCIVGWAYLLLSFTGTGVSRLGPALPTTRAAFEIWIASNPTAVTDISVLRLRTDIDPYRVYLGQDWMASHHGGQFYSFLNIVHCLCTLLFAFLAALIASYCVRRSETVEH